MISERHAAPEPIELDNFQFHEGFWHADNAPIFSRRKKSLVEGSRVSELQLEDTFFINLWGGEFEKRCYLMKVVRKRPQDGCFDCLWLTKQRKLLRNIVGGAIFSAVPTAAKVFHQRNKRKFVGVDLTEQSTPKKQARLSSAAVGFYPKIFHAKEVQAKPQATEAKEPEAAEAPQAKEPQAAEAPEAAEAAEATEAPEAKKEPKHLISI